MGDSEFPVPRKGDVLFSGDVATWHMDAMVDYHAGNDYGYRMGYRRAGKILTEYASEHREVDTLVFPICHAYRHFVELSLKHLMKVGCRIVGRELTALEARLQSRSHDLGELWACFKAIDKEGTEAMGAQSIPPEQLDGIEDYIAQLHAVDEGSFSFRYALTTKGDVSLEGTDRINLANFSNYMESLCNYLDGFDAYYADLLDAHHDAMSDMEHDMYGDAGY